MGHIMMPKYGESEIRKIVHQFPEIVKAYLNTIDVYVDEVELDQNPLLNGLGYAKGAVFYFECRTEDQNYIYFKDFTKIIRTNNYPKINMDAITGYVDDEIGLNDFTCFSTEIVVVFCLEVSIYDLNDIDSFMKMLKQKTKPIAYKKFSSKIDEEIDNELGN